MYPAIDMLMVFYINEFKYELSDEQKVVCVNDCGELCSLYPRRSGGRLRPDCGYCAPKINGNIAIFMFLTVRKINSMENVVI